MIQVSAFIINLRNMANDIGNVTTAQNACLERWELSHLEHLLHLSPGLLLRTSQTSLGLGWL